MHYNQINGVLIEADNESLVPDYQSFVSLPSLLERLAHWKQWLRLIASA